MSEGTLLIVLLIPMVVALAFGVWAGLGYPGRYDKYESTGRAPRGRTPWWWVLGSGRRGGRDLASDDRQGEEDEEGPPRPRFERKWRGRWR